MLDSKAIEEQEEITRKKYEINFEERKEKIVQYRKSYETSSPSDDNYEKTLIIPQNEKWYKKLFEFFRKIFKFI